MSLSKVLKNAGDFTPVSLVAETIDEKKTVFTPSPPDRNRQKDQFVPADKVPPVSQEQKSSPKSAIPSNPEAPQEQGQETTGQPPPPAQEAIDLDKVRQEAYQQGVQETRVAMENDMGAAVSAFTRAGERLNALCQQLLGEQHERVINLAIALTRHILGHEPETSRNLIARTLENALGSALKESSYEVWLHPDDLVKAQELTPELIESIQHLDTLHFRTDPSIQRGGCRVEGQSCLVDATLEAQLETAREFLCESATSLCLPESQENDPSPDEPQS